MTSSPRINTFKKTLSVGRGQLPEYVTGTKAIFHYECLRPTDLSQGMPADRDCYESIDSSKKHWPNGYGKPMELIFGKKFQLPVFETCLRSMNIDEISQFDVDPVELYSYPMVSKKLRDISHSNLDGHDHHSHNGHMCAASMAEGTGYPILDDLMKNPSPLRFIFHLLEVHQPSDYEAEGWQLNPEDKLKSVDQLKDNGNQAFKQKDYSSAVDKYREALTRLDNLILREKPGEPEWDELDNKNISLYLNLAQAYLSLGNYYEAISASNEVLDRDATNEKGLFRRAKARIGTWDLDKAEEDLNTLLQVHPSSERLVTAELQAIKQKRENTQQLEKNTYKNMFR